MLSVVVINYNTYLRTVRCLEAFYADAGAEKADVILVDNASTECDPKEFKLRFPLIRLIINKENLGFGKAADQGMEAAHGTYVLLLNSDCQVKKGCLRDCLTFLESAPGKRFDLLGCDIESPDGTKKKEWFEGGEDRSLKRTFQKGVRRSMIFSKVLPSISKREKAKDENIEGWRFREVNGLYGAFILLRKKVYLEKGGVDPDFFMYSEDIEWFQNRLKDYYRVGVLFNAKVIHEGGGSGHFRFPIRKQKLLSNYLYWYKLGYGNFWLFTFLEFINLILDLLVMPLVVLDKKKRAAFLAKLLTLPMALFRIPAASNGYGARKKDLRVGFFRSRRA